MKHFLGKKMIWVISLDLGKSRGGAVKKRKNKKIKIKDSRRKKLWREINGEWGSKYRKREANRTE